VRRTLSATLAVLALLIVGCDAGQAASRFYTQTEQRTAPVLGDGPYPVVHVSDGDTVSVRADSGVIRVRLIGVDTPEVKRPGVTVQCFGPEASAYTRRELLGRDVWLEHDPTVGDRDRYGRTLAYLRTHDRELFNLALIQSGHGREYTYRHQRYKYRSEFQAVESSAQTRWTGLWARCA
jgi:micrococcal nuclease